ncbi:MAG: hypothetical protein FWB72_00450 [Firmicutes bacterium]|nr:hypothetical protein [Bacillota bacterium]
MTPITITTDTDWKEIAKTVKSKGKMYVITEEEYKTYVQATKIANAETLEALKELDDVKMGKLPKQTMQRGEIFKWALEEN